MQLKHLCTLGCVLSALALPAAELYPAGDFEGNSTKPLHMYGTLIEGKNRTRATKETFTWRLQSEKAYSGKQSLLIEGKKNVSASLNIHSRKVQPGKKYEFSWRYFIAEGNPKLSVEGRVIHNAKGKKPRFIFPQGSAEPGKWHQVKTVFYPPVGTETISCTIWVGRGPFKVYIDDYKITEFEEARSVLVDSNTKMLKQGDVTIWKQSPYRRIDETFVPQNLKVDNSVELTAAANELEPFQLAVFPKTALKNVTAVFSDFKGKGGVIPASKQSFGVLHYIPMRAPDNPTLKGNIADPIVDQQFVDAPAGKNTTFYIRITAPKGTKAGVYNGSVTLKADGKELIKVPVKLTVRNFALPDTPAIHTMFYAHKGIIKRAYRDSRSEDAIRDDVMRIFRDHRITSSQCFHPAYPPVKVEGDTIKVTDWSEYDAKFKLLYDQGQRDFFVPYLGMRGDNGGWFPRSNPKARPIFFGVDMLSPRGLKLAGDYAKLFMDHWEKMAPPDVRYYSYIYDEPPAKVYKELNALTDGMIKRAPGFRFYTTHKVIPELRNMKVWCVPFGFGSVEPELEKGKEIWYYNWQTLLDHTNYIKARLYAWQIFANGAVGGLKWQVAATPREAYTNPWTDLEKCHSNGEATVIYPALKKGGNLIPCLRLAQVREGIDDADYLVLLKNKVEKYFPGMGQAYVNAQIKDLMPELPFGFVNDSEKLYDLRRRIGDEIEAFDAAPVALVTSMPANYSKTELSGVTIEVRGPKGASVVIDGKNAGTVSGKKFSKKIELRHFGLNKIPVTVKAKGKSKTFMLNFTLKRDPNLAKLEKLAKQLEAQKKSASELNAFLKKSNSGNYTAADRARCAKLVDEATRTLLKAQLAAVKPGKNALVNAVNKQAQWMFDNQLYTRAQYYLNLADEFAKSTLSAKSKLKIVPVNLSGNFGYRISNGLVEFTMLELGGRIVSFKVKGVECFDCYNLDKALPLKVRAGKLYEKFTCNTIPSLGGYEDAGWDVLPESAVDWDIAVKELSDKRIALEASMLMRGNKFRISRIMSMVPGKPELKIDYTISNVYPAEFKSDDPSDYQFGWRGRLCPKIGKNFQGDELYIPTDKKLKATVFDIKKPVFYEEKSVPLNKSALGSFNPQKKAGFTWSFDPSIRYAYIWFSTTGGIGEGSLYTLEIFRSFYGNRPGYAGNTPFSIEPGKSVNFSMTFTGKTAK